MRMIHRRRRDVVSTAKTRGAIPVANAERRDLLVQSTLDPHVRSIEFLHRIVHEGHAVPARSIVVHRDDGRYMMALAGDATDRSEGDSEVLVLGLRRLGIEVREIDRAEVRREPRFGNCRAIWAHRDDRAPARDRQRVLDKLAESGPQSIRELEDSIFSTYGVLPIVCVLACDDEVEIDIDSRPLGPETIVRLRR